ncbi:tape measure protein [Mycobacterium phage Marshawn]|uniref:Tape measure protein n=1 Tax=Mycobacterium phage Marshawn TaxID=2652423 RepID=A0A5P8D746_9CAUD|nr:endolysin [Mycobacterium phage Marshawn]QFP94808.1 tape measure protein [Mycobacterium phage Marshawn]
MAATYYLTVIPETSQVYSGIRRAARAADNITVHPKVDQRQAEREGRDYGNKFKRGFSSAAKGIGAGLGAITGGFKLAGDAAGSVVRHVGTAAAAIGIAAKVARSFSVGLLASASALRLVAGVSLARLAGALALLAGLAGRLSKQVSRVTSAVLVLAAVGKVLSFMHRAAKLMALGTIGASLAIGLLSAAAVGLGAALKVAWGFLLNVGAAAGVAAGAMVGILGPAIGVLKIGFKGLTDAAGTFTEQFKDADEAFNKMVGNRMGPMLAGFRELRMAIVDTFSATLQPAFASLGTFMDGMKPRATALTGTLGQIGNELAASLNSPVAQGALDTMFNASNRFFQNFLGESGLTGLSTGLMQFAATAADTFAGTGKGINDTLLKAGEWLRNIDASQMKLVFETLRASVQNVWNIIKPVIEGVRAIGSVTAPALAPGFSALGSAIGQAVPGLVQMAKILMPALSQVMERLAPVIPALVQAFTPWAGTLAMIAPPLASIVANLAPMAPMLLITVAAVKAMAIGMAVYNTAMLLAANATKIARTAWFLFNAAFIASPIGLIVVAIAALAAGLWAFFTKTETGRKLWEKIWTAIKTAASVAWEWIKNTLGKAWESIQPGLQKIGEVARQAFSTLSDAIKSVWTFIQPAVEWLGRLWLAVAKMEFGVAIGALKALGAVIGWLWQNVVVPAFGAIGTVISTWWSGVQIVWGALTTAIGFVGDKIMWLWQNVAVPAFGAIKGAVETFWAGATIIWDAFTNVLDTIGGKVVAFKDGIVTAFNAVKDVITTVWGAIGGIWDKIVGGIGTVADALKGAGGAVLNTLGLGGGATGGYVTGGAVLPRYATGGQINGPGTGTSDSILGFPAMVRVANGEYVTNAAATAGNLPLLRAINSGVPIWDMIKGLLPAFADGGLVSADQLVDFARGVDGQPYKWGGVDWGDCSGAVSAIANYATGRDPFGSRFATATEGDELAKRGFKPGVGPAGSLSVGWYNGGPGGGHTAATLPDGTNFEMGGAAGNGQFGGQAVGASDGKFTNRMHLPPEWFEGLDGGSSTIGSGTSASAMSAGGSGGGSYSAATSAQLSASGKKVDSAKTSAKNADQAVDDRQYAVDKAQRRVDELRAAGKDTSDAEHSLDVQTRELADARERQAKAHDKVSEAEGADNELRTKGKFKAGSGSSSEGGGLSGADFGKTFFSGIMESIGLDGSVFANPLEWPTIKSAMAGVNWAGGLLSGGTDPEAAAQGPGGFTSGVADGVGLGGLLQAIPGAVSDPTGLQVNPAVSGSSAVAEGVAGAAGAFAPDTTQHGQGNGMAPGPTGDVVFAGNVGMDPAALRGEFRSELNSRRRYT